MEVLLSGKPIQHPYSITFYKKNIYWTDWTKKAIFKMSLEEKNVSIVREKLDNIRDVHAYDQEKQPKGKSLLILLILIVAYLFNLTLKNSYIFLKSYFLWTIRQCFGSSIFFLFFLPI